MRRRRKNYNQHKLDDKNPFSIKNIKRGIIIFKLYWFVDTSMHEKNLKNS